MIMLYKIGLALIAYAVQRTRKTARELLQYQSESVAERASVLMEGEGAGETKTGEEIKAAAAGILRAVVIFGFAFAIIFPIATSMRFTTAIHRALIIILVATPISVITALPLSGIMGIAFSAQYGVLFNNAKTMEKVGSAKTVIFDKNGVFSDESPKLVAIKSDILDEKTFMDFIAHAAYYSEQPFAQAIASAYNAEYMLDVISDFHEIPGSGVELQISDKSVLLATASVMAERGVRIPQDVQLIGYDGITDYATGRHACSTIVQPIAQMAETAVRLLLDVEASAPRNICLPVRYAPGGTTKD
jgi:P-type E1-E2 ATPase